MENDEKGIDIDAIKDWIKQSTDQMLKQQEFQEQQKILQIQEQMIADRKIILEQAELQNNSSSRINRVSSMLNRTSHQIDSEGFHGLNATSTHTLGSKQITH